MVFTATSFSALLSLVGDRSGIRPVRITARSIPKGSLISGTGQTWSNSGKLGQLNKNQAGVQCVVFTETAYSLCCCLKITTKYVQVLVSNYYSFVLITYLCNTVLKF